MIYLFVLLPFLLFNVLFCEGVNDLPHIMEINNLHLTEEYSNAVKTLKDSSGLYCICHQDTGCMYIGSSLDLGSRLTDHFVSGSSNAHLQYAIAKYGLAAFTFLVIELCTKELLLEREQHWLNWLFSLPANLRYNFLPTAGSCFGMKHTDETKAKMSGNNKGCKNPMFGVPRVDLRKPVYVFDASIKVLITRFYGLREASKELQMSHNIIRKYIPSGKPFEGIIFSYSPSPKG
jgi:hypothetical protein